MYTVSLMIIMTVTAGVAARRSKTKRSPKALTFHRVGVFGYASTMNGSMVPLRTTLILAIIIVLIGFGLGFLHWNRQPLLCFDGKRFYGEWVTVFSFGKFELRLRAYGCPKADRYDPREFKRL